jgi:hypothetical protein
MNNRGTNTILALGLIAFLGGVIFSCSKSTKSGGEDPDLPEGLEVTIDRPIQLTPQARVPQDDPNYESAEVSANSIVFHYSEKPALALEAGNVIVGTGGNSSFLRRIRSVTSSSDTRVVVSTEAAELTDLILDGSFTLDFVPDAEEWTVGVEPGIGGRQLGLESELSIFSVGDDGLSCTPVVGTDPVKIVPILEPDFKHKVKVDIEATSYFPPDGKLIEALFLVDGSIEVGLEVDASVSGGVQCAIDLIEYLRDDNPHALKFERHVTFALGPIPMELTIFLEPIFKVEGTLSAKIDKFEARATTTFALKTGVHYDGLTEDWTGLFEPSTTTDVSMGLSEDAKISMSLKGKAQAGVTVGGLIYDTAGPFLSLTGFLEDEVEANFDDCTLGSKASFGAEVTVGLKAQIPVVAKELIKISLDPFLLGSKVVADLLDPLPLCLTIAEITPDSGVAGESISISGAGFVSDVSAMRVLFQDATNASNVLEATITGVTSTGTTGADMTVTSVEATVPTGVLADTAWRVSVEKTQAGVVTTSNQLGFGTPPEILIAAGESGDIIRIDDTTGAESLLLDTFVAGPLSAGTIASLLWNPAVNQLWAGAGGQGNCDGCLQRVDTTTGELFLVDAGNSGSALCGMAIRDASGPIHAPECDSRGMRTLSPTTGVQTSVTTGPSGVGGISGNGITFALDGTLYHVGESQLYVLNPADGTQISSTDLSFVGFPAAPEGVMSDLTVRASDGVLYASIDGHLNSGQGYIATINPVTSVVTYLATTSVPFEALAFVPSSAFP